MFVRTKFFPLVIILVTLFTLLAFPAPVSADTFSVNTNDDLDDGQCDSNHCSLREAINAANAHIGPDLIEFSSLDATNSEIKIELMSLLPPLLDNGTTIDGTTVGGYAGVPRVLVVKGVAVLEEGINIQGSNCTIRGLSLAGFGIPSGQQYPPIQDYVGGAIVLSGGGNSIEENVLGWGAWPNTVGLRMESSGNTAWRNTISGNGIGIFIRNHSQVIQGNWIGTDPSGTVAVPNAYGIYDDPASGGSHQIGGLGQVMGNLVSGNIFNGIRLQSDNNVVEGNYIGTDINGTTAIPNNSGIALVDAHNNLINTNTISGNTLYGVISLGDVSGSRLFGNQIGTNFLHQAIPNETGVQLFGTGLQIGGTGLDEGNQILNNPRAGIWVSSDASLHDIAGNTISLNGGAYNGGGVAFSLMGPPDPPGHRISQNSIFDNGGLGIAESGLNPMTPPWIMSVSGNTVTGGTCSDCEVEIFLVDPDPSGSGEGKTYLGTLSANASGDFSGTVSPIGYCQQITSTAFEPSHYRTSEFSINYLANCILFKPPLLIPIWTFIVLVFGGLGILIRRRNPARPPGLVPGGFGIGFLVAVGLTFIGTRLPAVQIHWTSGEIPPYQGELPSCLEFLDPEGFSPTNGAVLSSLENAMLEWVPLENLPEGTVRWLVEVEDFVSQSAAQVTPNPSIPLSSFGLMPMSDQTYGWTVQGQIQVDGDQSWTPFCQGLPRMTFEFSQSAQEEAAPEEPETPEPLPSEAPEACQAELVANVNLTCRSGPNALYEELGYLLEGETAIPEGISLDGQWYWILNPDWNGHCFVWSGGLEASCIGDLEVISVPEPTPTEPVCVSTMEQVACEAAGGTYFIGSAGVSCICPE